MIMGEALSRSIRSKYPTNYAKLNQDDLWSDDHGLGEGDV